MIFLASLTAALFWTALGWPLARRFLPAGLPPAAFAPVLGYAVHVVFSALVLPSGSFEPLSILWVAAALLTTSWAVHGRIEPIAQASRLPMIIFVLAGVLALLPAFALVPKHGALSAPIFDHSKIALVDAMVRGGLPPKNPFYGGPEGRPLAYYYWWHLQAAQVDRLFSIGGWAADGAMTWFTAYASLLLIAGIGFACAGTGVALTALALTLIGSLRPLLGWAEAAGWLAPGTGLGTWLNQVSWAPQHVAAGACLVVAALLVGRLAERATTATALLLAVVVAAGFGSSTWVGGITAALALPLAALALLWRIDHTNRLGFLWRCGLAGVLALLLASPLIRDQVIAGVSRAGGNPLAIAPFAVFGRATPGFLNIPGLPLLLLIEFPALAIPGAWALVRLARQHRTAPAWQTALAATALASIVTCCCLASTVSNNDLGWRAILPALLILPGLAAAKLARAKPSTGLTLLAFGALGLPGTARQLHENLTAHAAPFDATAAAWTALRHASAPEDRVASNPLLAADATEWPDNIAWALLSDRPSCYSGWATAYPFVPIPPLKLYATDQEFHRIFSAAPLPTDLPDLTTRLHCTYALLTATDPAWFHDPFAPTWRLVAKGETWRLYRKP